MTTHNQTVAVAVSGGADSLYTLVTLVEAGIPVIAIHGLFGQGVLDDFLFYQQHGKAKDSRATLGSGAFQARLHEGESPTVEKIAKACDSLGVPFHFVDFSEQFMARVVAPFVKTFAAGGTPNPCALCNTTIKFGLLLEYALSVGADRLATGHYALLLHPESDALAKTVHNAFEHSLNAPSDAPDGMPLYFSESLVKKVTPKPALVQGVDATKDQSYFLSLVQYDNLKKVIFPLGKTRKKDVLATLQKRHIELPQPGESQEICFIPGNAYREFLPFMAERLSIPLPEEGDALFADGRKIGRHKGLWHYTEGQRRGLGIAWSEPLHVLYKDRALNALVVGEKSKVQTHGLVCKDLNLLIPANDLPEIVYVKTRYRSHPCKAKLTLSPAGGEFPVNVGEDDAGMRFSMHLSFLEPEGAVAEGQLAAIYLPLDQECAARADNAELPLMRLVAGGIIASVER